MRNYDTLNLIAWALLIVGGINWGLIGLFEYDLVAEIFGAMSTMSRIIYTLVGLAAVYKLFSYATRSNNRTTFFQRR
jgi:uncharacterized protein